MAVLPAGAAVMLYYNAIDTSNYCNIVNTSQREEMAVLPAFTVILLYQRAMNASTDSSSVSSWKREMAVLPAFTAVQLHQRAMNASTDCSTVSSGQTGNDGSACSYCSTITTHCYEYMK